MSQIAPGWYPDATGRFAQRYHDGANWTEHVSDAAGNRGTDPLAPAAPVMPLAPPAAPGAPGAPGAWGPAGGAPAPGFGAGYGAAPFGAPGGAPAGTGFVPTVGLITAGIGGVLVLLSLLALDFLSGGGQSISLDGLSDFLDEDLDDFGIEFPIALETYVRFGRFLAIPAVIVAVAASARLVPALNDLVAIPILVAAMCGAFALWHLAALLIDFSGSSPAIGGFVGVVGWVVLAASPFLKMPISGSR